MLRDMMAGETLTLENVRAIHPGILLPPMYIDVLIGKTIKVDASRGTPLEWEFLK